MSNPTLDTTIETFTTNQRKARYAFIITLTVVLAATVSTLAYLGYRSHVAVVRAEQIKKLAEAQKATDEQTLRNAEADLHVRWDLRTDRPLDRSAILAGTDGDLEKRVISLAINLYEHRPSIPFVWGGKFPSQGFDSSGYVAYVLSAEHLPIDPTTYYSGRLRQDLSPVPFERRRPGDVVLYDGGQCTFFLGGPDELVIGMAPGGIFTGNIQTYGAPRAVRRYDQLMHLAPAVKDSPQDK